MKLPRLAAIVTISTIPLTSLEVLALFYFMARKRKVNDYGTGIPIHEVDALARVLLPEIQAFFESEDGQREFAEWKAQQEQNKIKQG